MAEMNAGVVTNAGQALLALSIERGQKLNFTRMATSSQDYTDTALEDLATLAGIEQDGAVTLNEALDDGRLMAESLLINTNVTQGYDVNAIGLYANLPGEAEVLFSVATAKNADHIPAYNERTPTGAYLRMYTALHNTDNFTVSVDMAAIATRDMVDALRTQMEAGLQGKADTSTVDAALAKKANITDVETGLAGKLDKTAKAADSALLNGQAAGYYATASAVATAQSTANAAMPKSGGTFTGVAKQNAGVGTSAASQYQNLHISGLSTPLQFIYFTLS